MEWGWVLRQRPRQPPNPSPGTLPSHPSPFHLRAERQVHSAACTSGSGVGTTKGSQGKGVGLSRSLRECPPRSRQPDHRRYKQARLRAPCVVFSSRFRCAPLPSRPLLRPALQLLRLCYRSSTRGSVRRVHRSHSPGVGYLAQPSGLGPLAGDRDHLFRRRHTVENLA